MDSEKVEQARVAVKKHREAVERLKQRYDASGTPYPPELESALSMQEKMEAMQKEIDEGVKSVRVSRQESTQRTLLGAWVSVPVIIGNLFLIGANSPDLPGQAIVSSALAIWAIYWTVNIAIHNTGAKVASAVVIASGIVQVIVTFAVCYLAISLRNTKAFNVPLHSWTALYYSVVTFTTTGYGDILPVSNLARATAEIEMILGYLCSALVLAILVSLILDKRREFDL